MWARVDYCSVILFDGFQTTKARDHMALFVFTKMSIEEAKSKISEFSQEYLLQLRTERLKYETKINDLQKLKQLSPIEREVSEIEINNRIRELEKRLAGIYQTIVILTEDQNF